MAGDTNGTVKTWNSNWSNVGPAGEWLFVKQYDGTYLIYTKNWPANRIYINPDSVRSLNSYNYDYYYQDPSYWSWMVKYNREDDCYSLTTRYFLEYDIYAGYSGTLFHHRYYD